MCYTLLMTANKPETALYRVVHFFLRGYTHLVIMGDGGDNGYRGHKGER